MISYLSLSFSFYIIEYFSYLNPRLIMSFLFIILFFPLLSPRQLLNSSQLCSDVVSESPSTLFPLFLIAIIISPALIISLDSEIIIIPSSIIYSCGYQWAWTFPSPHPNRVCNCDHYAYPPYYSSKSMPFISIRYGFSQPSLESIEHVIPFYPFISSRPEPWMVLVIVVLFDWDLY